MAVSANDLIVGPLTPALGVTTISLDFYFEQAAWLEVYKSGSETALVLNTDYTVTGAGTGSGVVTLTDAADGVSDYTVYLVVPLQRSSDMQTRGGFQSEPFNLEMDRLWQAMQRLSTLGQRSFRVGATADAPDVYVPEPETVMGFDAGGNTVLYPVNQAVTVVPDPIGVVRFATATAALADVTMGYTAGASVPVAAGDYVVTTEEGFSYEVAASGASDHHLTTAGGVKLYVLVWLAGDHVKAFGAVGDGVADDTAAIQKAFDAAEARRLLNGSLGATVSLGNSDKYLVSSTVVARNISIEGHQSKIVANTDINILRIEGNVHLFRDFHCWYTTQRTNSAAIAIKLTDGTGQASKNTFIGVTTRYAYTGFYNLKTGGAASDGSIFGTVFINCRADYNYDWGWYLYSGGATTVTLINCAARGDIAGGLTGSKGYYFRNINDLVLSNCSADQMMNGYALQTTDVISVSIDTFAMESCSITTNGVSLIYFTTASSLRIGCILAKVTTVNVGVGNTAYIVKLSTCLANNFNEILSTTETLTSGTFYKLRTSSTGRNVTSFVPLSEVDVVGNYQNFFDFSRFVGLTSSDPTSAFATTHVAGDIALNRSVIQGREVGWVCTTAGTPGTWMPFGQAGVMTSVGATPRYVGQLAVVGGVGYMATGVASSADWKQIT